MFLPLKAHQMLVKEAIQLAHQAGDLPSFEIPPITIEPCRNPDHGDYAFPAMSLARYARMDPRQIAAKILKHLPEREFLGSAEIAGAGYVNFHLDTRWLCQHVNTILEKNEAAFHLDIGQGQLAQVEFVSANPTGPLHIGRSRGAVVGDTLARILESVGYQVQREYYFNNAGVQMQNLGESLRRRYLEALGYDTQWLHDADDNLYHGEYLKEFARELVAEKRDSWVDEDWHLFKVYGEQRMFDMIQTTLTRIGIHHDHFFNENSLLGSGGAVDQVMDRLKASGDMYEAVVWEGADEQERAKFEGQKPAWWFRSTRYGDEKDRVMIKSDGAATYTLPDFAYHQDKLARGYQLAVNVLGADHHTQAKVVQYGLRALGEDPSKIRPLIVQMVHLVKNDTVQKQSTRSGNFETLDDLIDQTSVDAVRYLLLARSPNTELNFDVDLAVSRSDDNPVYYIQNAHVRCVGIIRETSLRNMSNSDPHDVFFLGDQELKFVKKMLYLSEVLTVTVADLEPHRVAFYTHELAGIFHSVYEQARVLGQDVPENVAHARIRFYQAARIVFQYLLNLMGMSAPESM